MTGSILITGSSSLMFSAAAALIRSQKKCYVVNLHILFNSSIRYIFVRTSLQKEITLVLKRSSFTFKFLLLGFCYTLINIWVYTWENYDGDGVERSRFVLFRACVDPDSRFSLLIVRLAPLSQLLLYTIDIVIIVSNLILYRFLEKQRKNNSGNSPKNMHLYELQNIFSSQRKECEEASKT